MKHYPEFEALLMEQEAGATTLLFKYIHVLKRFFIENENLSIDEQKQEMNLFYEKVVKAHPLVALFPNINNYLMNNDGNLVKLLDAFEENINKNIKLTLKESLKLIKKNNKIFTFSHSSIVRKSIMNAVKQNVPISVTSTEARPVCEGTALAKFLSTINVPVSLYTDAAMERAIDSSDMVLIGTDWYWEGGFVNKIGTHSALRIAYEREVPFYILADSSKSMNRAPSDWSKDKHNSTDILKESKENITVFNPYFESIWYKGVTGIIIDGKMKTFDKNGKLEI